MCAVWRECEYTACELPASYNRESHPQRLLLTIFLSCYYRANSVSESSVDNGVKTWSLALVYLRLTAMSTPEEKVEKVMVNAQTAHDFGRFWPYQKVTAREGNTVELESIQCVLFQ